MLHSLIGVGRRCALWRARNQTDLALGWFKLLRIQNRGAMRTHVPDLSRRFFLTSAAVVAGYTLVRDQARGAIVKTDIGKLPAFGNSTLPSGIRSRIVSNINGVTMHVLEAGFEPKGQPCVLLLHGFPELAYSWRKVMLPLASAGFHVVAPDQRGYGRTTGWDDDYDGDLDSFRLPNLVRDALGLVSALGYRSVTTVVGHDFGSPVAAYCALIRPDVFRSVVLMSAPFAGPPSLPFNTAEDAAAESTAASSDINADLAALHPPRKHYQSYYGTREANANMRNAPQGIHAFLRAYYHIKSADWKQNRPFRLKSYTAEELAQIPRYYVMDRDKGMAETVAVAMPSAKEIAACKWLREDELSVYSSEFARTGFQGGLQWYRCRGGKYNAELETLSGRTIDVPSMFIAGKSDWGAYQSPGALERMQSSACTKMLGVHLVDGAGHWVQQEQPEEVSRLLVQFVRARSAEQAK
jgi:pimeloyl-ACP methyl ester carboxylesterase